MYKLPFNLKLKNSFEKLPRLGYSVIEVTLQPSETRSKLLGDPKYLIFI